jgi:hypothetical protein
MADIPGFDPIPADDYEQLLLTTQEQVDKYWPRASKLVEKCIKRSMHGEMDVEDIKRMVLSQKAYVFVVKNDSGIQPDVRLVVILEMLHYPKLPALNILVLAGSELDVFFEKFWQKLCGWAYMNGVRAIEGMVSPAMQRVISRYGFKPVYTQMRLNLSEA